MSPRQPTPTTKSKRGSKTMRVNLKGLFWAPARLADGTKRIYWYAWRGGPRLRGEPGDPEFVASYNEAVATRITAPAGRLLSLFEEYQRSTDFTGLRDRTRADYIKQFLKIEARFGDMPIKALADPRARGVFLGWRDELAVKSRRQADYAFAVLARVLAWAKERGKITVNPCERAKRIYHGTRVDKVWSIEDEAAFLRSAPAHLHLPLLLALWTGQRQGDLLALAWSAFDGTVIKLRQSKTMVHVSIPIGGPLKAARRSGADAAKSRHSLEPGDGPPLDGQRLQVRMGEGVPQGGYRRRNIRRPARHRRHKAGARVTPLGNLAAVPGTLATALTIVSVDGLRLRVRFGPAARRNARSRIRSSWIFWFGVSVRRSITQRSGARS
jgi:integrase